MVSTVQDVTERARAEKELAEAHDRLAATLAALPDLMFEVDVKGRIYDYYAPRTEALYAQPEEFLGKMVEDVLPADAAGVILKALTQAAAEGSHRGDTYALDLPGGRCWFELSIATKPGGSATDGHLIALVRNITERKRIEEALRESEQRLNDLAEQSCTTTWEVDHEGLFTYVSRVCQSSWGYRPDEVVGRMHFYDLHPEEGREAYKAAVFAITERKQPFRDIVHPVETKDGRLAWGSTNGLPLVNADGTLRGYRGSCTDITERKRAEEALKESEERLRSIFVSTPDSITVVDLDERIKLCNQSTANIYGFRSAEQLIGKHLSEFVAEKDHPRMKEAKKHVMIRGFAKDVPFTGLKISGETFAGEITFDALRDSSGRPVGFVGITRDISERKRTEAALRQSEERFRQVAETVSDFIWEVDVDGLYTYTSPSVEKILGYTPDELVGKMHFYDLFLPELREQLKNAAFGAFKARQRFQAFPNSNLTKSGRIVYLETSGMPILDEAGRLLGYRGADTDITNRH